MCPPMHVMICRIAFCQLESVFCSNSCSPFIHSYMEHQRGQRICQFQEAKGATAPYMLTYMFSPIQRARLLSLRVLFFCSYRATFDRSVLLLISPGESSAVHLSCIN